MSDAQAVQGRAVFTGMVQGVGFRYTTVRIASSYAVTGYVRNEADGSVELVAEGVRREVSGFIDAVSERMGHYVRDARVTWGPATGSYEGFGVRYSW